MNLCRSPDYLIGQAYDISFVNSMIEFKHITKLSDDFNAREYDRIMRDLDDNLSISVDIIEYLDKSGYNLYDNLLCVWLVKEECEKYMYGYVKSGYVRYDEKKKKFECVDRYVLVSRRTEIMLNREILLNIADINLDTVKLPKLDWVNGPPGCG